MVLAEYGHRHFELLQMIFRGKAVNMYSQTYAVACYLKNFPLLMPGTFLIQRHCLSLSCRHLYTLRLLVIFVTVVWVACALLFRSANLNGLCILCFAPFGELTFWLIYCRFVKWPIRTPLTSTLGTWHLSNTSKELLEMSGINLPCINSDAIF